MGGEGQLDLLLELHELEKALKKKRGKEKKKVQERIDQIVGMVDPWVLKHYRRLKIPFGEFRDRTCWGCGMIYPKTHVHCRPSVGDVRLCESCGRILLLIDEENNSGSSKRITERGKRA